MRTLFDDGLDSDAVFSPCRTWRYSLTRTWDTDKPAIAFIGLNPSIANENRLDATTKKCVAWARRDGFGRYVMLNLFAMVSTDPQGLKTAVDPVGPETDAWIEKTLQQSKSVVFCWGCTYEKLLAPRIAAVEQITRNTGLTPQCLGVTGGGFPKHPLYLRNDTRMVPLLGWK